MTTFWNQIEKQNRLHDLLNAYGVTFQSNSLGNESEMSYTKSNGGGKAVTILSYDIDLADVMQENKIEGLTIISSYKDSGFKTASFPVTIVNFD